MLTRFLTSWISSNTSYDSDVMTRWFIREIMKSIMERQQIIRSITAFFEDRCITWNRVYIGVTNNAEKRLFQDHNVDREEDDYIVCQSRSANEARTIEGYFQELGASGFNGGGNDTSSIVYAYRKRGYTIE